MKLRILAATGLACMALGFLASGAEQGPFAAQSQAEAVPAQAQLDQLLAPIALYPDDLLANVLTAATYPLEVVSLSRWLDSHPGLAGEDLEAALASQPWDDSVKALAPFRSVVAMMNGELDWTQRVGDAFLGSEAEVMDTVQGLRRKAREAGSLQDNSRERVVDEEGSIVIEPLEPSTIYVPAYDPRVVYGPWWWPDYPPYLWADSYFGPWDYVVGGIGFGLGIYWSPRWHGHRHCDWHGHGVVSGTGHPWQHQPPHRGGVPYVDPRARDRYGSVDRSHVQQRGEYRGFDPQPRGAPPSSGGSRAPHGSQVPRGAYPTGPSPLRPVPNQAAQQHAQRGQQSLGRPSSPSAGRSRGR